MVGLLLGRSDDCQGGGRKSPALTGWRYLSAMADQERPPAQHGILHQGMRFGSIGCVGCATFVVLIIVVLVVVLVLAGHES
jgi:hypothetical protein